MKNVFFTFLLSSMCSHVILYFNEHLSFKEIYFSIRRLKKNNVFYLLFVIWIINIVEKMWNIFA